MHRPSFYHLALALALLATPAWAHFRGISTSDYVLGGDGRVQARMTLALADLASIDPGAKDPASAAVARKIWDDGVEVKGDGRACTPSDERASMSGSDGLDLAATYACPAGTKKLQITLFFLDDVFASHRHVARISAGRDTVQKILSPADRAVVWESPEAGRPAPRPHGPRAPLLLVAAAIGAAFALWLGRRRARRASSTLGP